MKLIIDISENDRTRIGNLHFVPEELRFDVAKAIMNGTPLPKDLKGWIPANQPPKASGKYIVTRHFCNNDFVEMASYATDLHKVDKYDFPKHKAGWYNYDSEYGHYEVDDVVAWMPIEPYKASPTGAERSTE